MTHKNGNANANSNGDLPREFSKTKSVGFLRTNATLLNNKMDSQWRFSKGESPCFDRRLKIFKKDQKPNND
jgi:hypothetical protein